MTCELIFCKERLSVLSVDVDALVSGVGLWETHDEIRAKVAGAKTPSEGFCGHLYS